MFGDGVVFVSAEVRLRSELKPFDVNPFAPSTINKGGVNLVTVNGVKDGKGHEQLAENGGNNGDKAVRAVMPQVLTALPNAR